LNVPFWPDSRGKLFSISPREVIASPEEHAERKKQIMEADARYPVHIVYFKGRPLILDGLHRLTQAVMEGKDEIAAKIVLPERLVEIVSEKNTVDRFNFEHFRNSGEVFARTSKDTHPSSADIKK
jgi:hypothetical protein